MTKTDRFPRQVPRMMVRGLGWVLIVYCLYALPSYGQEV